MTGKLESRYLSLQLIRPGNRTLMMAMMMMGLAGVGCQSHGPIHQSAAPEEKAISFLMREVPSWSRENGCFSCHNNGDAARALFTAMQHGRLIPAMTLADTAAWLGQPDRWEHNKGDPGFSDQRLADIQFAASLVTAIEAGQLKNRFSLDQAARKLVASQDADGAWQIERQNPVGSPATYGTPLATLMAWQTLVAAGSRQTSEAKRHAEQWLGLLRPENTPTAAVVLLFAAKQPGGGNREAKKDSLEFLRRAQTPDGGWGPYADSPSEVFDTALALLALADWAAQPDSAAIIRRGRTFLMSQQAPDGAWPATTRPSGGNSYAQRISTTGWATLALLRTGGESRRN